MGEFGPFAVAEPGPCEMKDLMRGNEMQKGLVADETLIKYNAALADEAGGIDGYTAAWGGRE